MPHGVGGLIQQWIDYKKVTNPGYTQKQLGEDSGIDPNYISQIISGHRKYPRKATLAKLAKGFGVPLEKLYDGPPRVLSPVGVPASGNISAQVGIPANITECASDLSTQDILMTRIQKRLMAFRNIDLLEIIYRQIVFYGELENHISGEGIHNAFVNAFGGETT